MSWRVNPTNRGGGGSQINDNVIQKTSTWSSEKINDEIQALLNNSNDPDDNYVIKDTLTDRDAIDSADRKVGLLCYVEETDTFYYLKDGILNTDWHKMQTGSSGSEQASDIKYKPSGSITGTNVQSAIDELEKDKANAADVYSKAEVDNEFANFSPDYNNLQNKPDLTNLHDHQNKNVLDKFTQLQGQLLWDGKSFGGDMTKDVYDTDGDGIIDVAKTLDGLNATNQQLNYSIGLTGNIQAQLDAISSGTIFKGVFATYAQLTANLQNPETGFWVFVEQDENNLDQFTQYYHDGTDWIYGGGAADIPKATDTVTGGIKLAGALGNPNGTADAPLLNETGVQAGTYKNVKLVVDPDGRITHIEEEPVPPGSVYIDDTNTSTEEVWSSQKVQDELDNRSEANHTHYQLHDPEMLGNTRLDNATRSANRVITYNAVTGRAEWQDSFGGQFFVGSKILKGDIRFVPGTNVDFAVDDQTNEITIIATQNNDGDNPALSQLTKLGVVATKQNPKKYDLFIPSTANFLRQAVEVLKFESGIQSVMSTEVNFDNSDATDFETNNNITFDGEMKLATVKELEMERVNEWDGAGHLFEVEINPDEYKSIFGLL